MMELEDRVVRLTAILVESAGIDPVADARIGATIQGYRDLIQITLEDIDAT